MRRFLRFGIKVVMEFSVRLVKSDIEGVASGWVEEVNWDIAALVNSLSRPKDIEVIKYVYPGNIEEGSASLWLARYLTNDLAVKILLVTWSPLYLNWFNWIN